MIFDPKFMRYFFPLINYIILGLNPFISFSSFVDLQWRPLTFQLPPSDHAYIQNWKVILLFLTLKFCINLLYLYYSFIFRLVKFLFIFQTFYLYLFFVISDYWMSLYLSCDLQFINLELFTNNVIFTNSWQIFHKLYYIYVSWNVKQLMFYCFVKNLKYIFPYLSFFFFYFG